MSKVIHLPLLAALPALLAACGNDQDLSRYSRTSYNSYAQCQAAYREQIRQGLQNPCQKTSRTGGGFFYFGPYILNAGGTTRYVGYTPAGGVAATGLTSGKSGYSTFKAPSVSRGGFTTSSRASGSFGG